MSTKQQNLIRKFRSQFPDASYLWISKQTNIQQTRVFRIFNGSEMKISEFTALEELLYNSSQSKKDQLWSLFKAYSSKLSETQIQKLILKYEQSFALKELTLA